jgi:hypothetical protein
VITNFFMKDFEEEALNKADYKPMCWFHSVNNTFIVWPYGDVQENWMTSLTTSTANIPTSNSPWRVSQMATFHTWILTYTEDWTVSWVTPYTGSSPTLTYL